MAIAGPFLITSALVVRRVKGNVTIWDFATALIAWILGVTLAPKVFGAADTKGWYCQLKTSEKIKARLSCEAAVVEIMQQDSSLTTCRPSSSRPGASVCDGGEQ